VFEIGPEFRADAGATRRHLTEFTALSMEMAIYEHYHEAHNHSHLLILGALGLSPERVTGAIWWQLMDLVEDLFVWIIEGIKTRNGDDLAALRAQYPSMEDVVYARPSLRLSFEEAVALLDAATPDRLGAGHHYLSFSDEHQLARLVKLHHGVDFFIVDKSLEDTVPYYSRVLCPHDQVIHRLPHAG
jgi:aspartyl-tRNA synthetase